MLVVLDIIWFLELLVIISVGGGAAIILRPITPTWLTVIIFIVCFLGLGAFLANFYYGTTAQLSTLNSRYLF